MIEEGKIAKAWVHTISPFKVKFETGGDGYTARLWGSVTGLSVNSEVRVSEINGRLEAYTFTSTSVDDTGWTDLSLLNGWTRYSSAYACRYRRLNGWVSVEALLSGPATSAVVATLPVGFRPNESVFGAGYNNGSDKGVRVHVLSNGTLSCYANALTSYTGLLISFPADTGGGGGGYDTGWLVPPDLVNGWGEYSTGYPLRYRRLDGIVYLTGLISGGTEANMFTLPAGFRPFGRRLFTTMTTGYAVARVDVHISGIVGIGGGTYSSTWVSLDGISFPADG